VGGREVTLSKDGCNTSSTFARDLSTPTPAPPHKGEGNYLLLAIAVPRFLL
jgi:hypothetical protein